MPDNEEINNNEVVIDAPVPEGDGIFGQIVSNAFEGTVPQEGDVMTDANGDTFIFEEGSWVNVSIPAIEPTITEQDVNSFMNVLSGRSTPTTRRTRRISPTFIESALTWSDNSTYKNLSNNKINMKQINKDGTVILYESGDKVPENEAIYVARYDGWFPKNTKDVHKDILNPDINILLGKKHRENYKGMIRIVYTSIDNDGNLSEPRYTVNQAAHFIYPSLYPYISNDFGAPVYITFELLNNDIFKKYFKESLMDGQYYHISMFDNRYSKKHAKYQYRKCKSRFKVSDDINKPTTYIKTLGKRYSFGLEIETSSGFLPHYLDSIIDYSAVHDGSLRDAEGHTYGGEYVTGVLKGDRGLLQSKMLCNELSKRCMVNHLCGVHTHIGDVNFTKENIVLMYYLYRKLEKEIFSMLPPSRRKNEFCRELPPLDIDLDEINENYSFSIDFYYNKIIAILSQRDGCSDEVNKKKDHPKGHKCNYDHSTARYCWVNFIPAVFNTRGNGVQTIEFRPHSATTSYYKIKNWLLICMALVDIVENHKDIIYIDKNLSLNKIITLVYPKDNKKLLDYIEKRINKFSTKGTEESDYTDNEVEENVTIKNI